MGKQFYAVARTFGITGSGVEIECDLVEAEFVVEFVQPTATFGWRTNNGALFQMVR